MRFLRACVSVRKSKWIIITWLSVPTLLNSTKLQKPPKKYKSNPLLWYNMRFRQITKSERNMPLRSIHAVVIWFLLFLATTISFFLQSPPIWPPSPRIMLFHTGGVTEQSNPLLQPVVPGLVLSSLDRFIQINKQPNVNWRVETTQLDSRKTHGQ